MRMRCTTTAHRFGGSRLPAPEGDLNGMRRWTMWVHCTILLCLLRYPKSRLVARYHGTCNTVPPSEIQSFQKSTMNNLFSFDRCTNNTPPATRPRTHSTQLQISTQRKGVFQKLLKAMKLTDGFGCVICNQQKTVPR